MNFMAFEYTSLVYTYMYTVSKASSFKHKVLYKCQVCARDFEHVRMAMFIKFSHIKIANIC